MLAQSAEKPFDDKNWLFEIKWDGYRAIADLSKKNLQFHSRNGISFAEKFITITEHLERQPHKMILDGEIVAYDSSGLPNFQLLQQIDKNPNLSFSYQVFDLLWLNGHSTMELPLIQRKELLKDALGQTEIIKYSDHMPKNGIEFFDQMKKMNLEGMIAKNAQSFYVENLRSSDWLKIKITQTEEVIVCGFTAPKGSRKKFGALILGKYVDNQLVYCGHTGTGFDAQKLNEVFDQLKKLIIKKSPFAEIPKTNAPATWVKPQLVCEIKFTEITKDGIYRHPVFITLRKDKDVNEINSKSGEMKTKKKSTQKIKEKIILNRHTVTLTNQEKVYFPKEEISKGDILDYYQSVSKYILPHLKNRPLSLNRFPNGIEKLGFYHKDAGENAPEWVKTHQVFSESTDKYIDYIICNDKATLAYLNNLGCIDFNPWNSTVQKLENPDYLVLDLDPSEKNSFDDVIEVALQTHEILKSINVEGYCKTSGSTGIHIYLPMGKKYSYDQVKDFAHILMKEVNHHLPKITTLERNLKKRGKNKIYLDYLQNRKGQTLASVYSLRPKEGAAVSMPLEWNELKKGLKPTDFNIYNTLERINSKGDIFLPVLKKGINLMKTLKIMEEKFSLVK